MFKVLFLGLIFSLKLMPEDKKHSWYTHWGFGISQSYYSENLSQVRESFYKSSLSDKNIVFNIDLYGFYFPFYNEKILLGTALNLVGDFIYINSTRKAGAISHIIFGPSIFYFIDKIRKGFFFRLDLGISKFSVDGNRNLKFGAKTFDSKIGWGGILGSGYSFNVRDEFGLVLSFLFSIKEIESENIKSVSFLTGLII